MKTILVDAVHTFVSSEGVIDDKLHVLLEQYHNPKIIVTNADYEADNKYNLKQMPYEVFTLRHNPKKIDPVYYTTLLKQYDVQPQDVVYFEHSQDAATAARSVGIATFYFDSEKRDIKALKHFLDTHI